MMQHNQKHLFSDSGQWLARLTFLLLAALLLNGCSSKRPLIPTPDIYALGIQQPFTESLPAELRTVGSV